MKQIKVGIYRFQIQNQDLPVPPLSDVLKAIQDLPDNESRTMLIDAPIRPRPNPVIADGFVVLDFNRIRQTDRITLADIKGVEGEIKFGPQDKKPSERTAIAIDKGSNAVFIHEHAWAISHSLFARYFKAILKVTDVISSVVINEGGLERLQGKSHRVMKIRLAGIDNARALKAQGLGDRAILKLLEEFRAPDATISLSIEPHDEATLDNVIETA